MGTYKVPYFRTPFSIKFDHTMVFQNTRKSTGTKRSSMIVIDADPQTEEAVGGGGQLTGDTGHALVADAPPAAVAHPILLVASPHLPLSTDARDENTGSSGGTGDATVEPRLRTPTSPESARSGLRRSERLHALHSMADALRDRSPDTSVIFTTSVNAGGLGREGVSSKGVARPGKKAPNARPLSISTTLRQPVSQPSFRAALRRPQQSPSPPGKQRRSSGFSKNVASTSRVTLSPKHSCAVRRSSRKLRRAPRANVTSLRLSSQQQQKVRHCKMAVGYFSDFNLHRNERLLLNASKGHAQSKQALCVVPQPS